MLIPSMHGHGIDEGSLTLRVDQPKASAESATATGQRATLGQYFDNARQQLLDAAGIHTPGSGPPSSPPRGDLTESPIRRTSVWVQARYRIAVDTDSRSHTGTAKAWNGRPVNFEVELLVFPPAS